MSSCSKHYQQFNTKAWPHLSLSNLSLSLSPVLSTSQQHPSSTTPPIDIVPSRLKLMRRGPDRKSEFLRALKDEGTGELTGSSSSPGEVRTTTDL